MFSNDHNRGHNVPGFIDHRHDQSVFSILRKKYNVLQIEDETWGDNLLNEQGISTEFKSIPFLATRLSGAHVKAKSWPSRIWNSVKQGNLYKYIRVSGIHLTKGKE